MWSELPGRIVIVSAPSGAGKTTVVRRLVASTPRLVVSCSYTSRPPRGGERDGADYHFVDRGRFERMRDAGEFLEWAEVFGRLYGTRRADSEAILAGGDDLVLVIDVQGAAQIRRAGVPSVGIFLVPPSFETLEARLSGRQEDSPEQIRRRLEVARRELEAARDYDYVVVNDDLETCVTDVRGLVLAERARTDRRWPLVTALLERFPGSALTR